MKIQQLVFHISLLAIISGLFVAGCDGQQVSLIGTPDPLEPPETVEPVAPKKPADWARSFDWWEYSDTPVNTSGNLGAVLRLVQSHTARLQPSDPDNAPLVVPSRTALALLRFDGAANVRAVTLSVTRGDQSLKLPMTHPWEQMRSDRPAGISNPDIRYDKQAWSAEIPWYMVGPGMSLSATVSAPALQISFE